MYIAIHANPALPHQIAYAEYFKEGFKRHGLKSEITSSPTTPADLHVIQGPHFAKNAWLGHPNVILLDREYYHGEFTAHPRSMDWVSVGWMRLDGGRSFVAGNGRETPSIQENSGEGSIFLADYNGPIEQADTVRFHPAQEYPQESLESALERHKTAIGYTTSALVTAGLMGLEVRCLDKRNIMFEKNWLQLLPYAEWRYDEIETGETWAHLIWSQRQLNIL